MTLSHVITASLLLAIVGSTTSDTAAVRITKGSLRPYEGTRNDDTTDSSVAFSLAYSAGRFGKLAEWWFKSKSHHLLHLGGVTSSRMVLECAVAEESTELEADRSLCEMLTLNPYSNSHGSFNELVNVDLGQPGRQFAITLLYNPNTFKIQFPLLPWKRHVNIKTRDNSRAGFRLHLKTPKVSFDFKHKRLERPEGFPRNKLYHKLNESVDFKLPVLEGEGDVYSVDCHTEVSQIRYSYQFITRIVPKPFVHGAPKPNPGEIPVASLVPVKGGSLKVVSYRESIDSLPLYGGGWVTTTTANSKTWDLWCPYTFDQSFLVPSGGIRTANYKFAVFLNA